MRQVRLDIRGEVVRARRGAMLQRYWALMLVLWLLTVAGLYLV